MKIPRYVVRVTVSGLDFWVQERPNGYQGIVAHRREATDFSRMVAERAAARMNLICNRAEVLAHVSVEMES